MASALTLVTKFTAVDKFSPAVRKMATSTRRFANRAVRNIARVNQRLVRMQKGLMRFMGAFGLVMSGYMIGAGLINVVKVWGDFEDANVNLAAVLAKTGGSSKALSNDAKRLGTITAKTATEVVGLQLSLARLGFAEQEILNMTEATISASVAMKASLSETADLVGAMVRSFDTYSSINSTEIVDKLTMATQKSALSFEKLQKSLPIVAGAANAAGIDFSKLLALLGKLSDAGIDASTSATALRNIFIQSAKYGLDYDQILKFIVKSSDKLSASFDAFGKRPAVSALILGNKLAETDVLEGVIDNSQGASQKAAAKQLESLYGRITLLKSAYQGWILAVEDGNGTINKSLKKWIDGATGLLLMTNNSKYAREEAKKMSATVRKTANTLKTFLQILKWIAIAFVAVKLALLAYSVVMIAFDAIMLAASGVMLLWKGLVYAYNFVVGLATVAQWAWNAAMWANPIGLVVAAIILLIAYVYLVTKHWEDWGAALGLVNLPLVMLISLIKTFRKNWDAIKKAFTVGGIIAGLKAVGKTILEALLYPIIQLLKLINKIPGAGKYVAPALNWLEGVNDSIALNPDAAAAEVVQKNFVEQRNTATLNINDKSNSAEVEDDGGMKINLSNNLGQFAWSPVT